ncbi:hypothetical protein HDU96_000708 [Phlyctochytrium bullatum]|nr:hypothetical protein HDU96_000708 [Phlyctochytrium bullatum]
MTPLQALLLTAVAVPLVVAQFVSTPCSMLRQVNNYRRSFNPPIPALVLDRRLVAVAQYHAEDQAANNLMTHDSPDGTFWGTRLAQYFPNWNYLAENVARNSENETEIMGVWIRSPDHERNLRDSRARYFGSGYRSGFWSQDFGNSGDRDVLFPVDCTREDGFAWPQPAVKGQDFVGTIVTPENLCLDGQNGRGGILIATTCVRGNLSQSWTLKQYGAGFYVQQTGTNLCLDVFNESRANGSVIGVCKHA